MIQEELLIQYGGSIRKYYKEERIFFEGCEPLFYYQVSSGSVRMVNIFDDGKEFIQGIFTAGESFGEPVLLLNAVYPATAIANEVTLVLKIKKENFLYLLHHHTDILFSFTQMLCKRLLHKSVIAREISGEKPAHRIYALLMMMKKQNGCFHDKKFKVELSRQRIADMVGLRVETVIRAMKQLEQKGFISIQKGKVYV
jgi:CRP-like cAMP-binding protein